MMTYSVPIFSSLTQTIEEYAASLPYFSDIKVKQLSKGEFLGRSTVVDLHDVSITRRSNKVSYSTEAWISNYTTFIFPSENNWVYLNGKLYTENEQIVVIGNQQSLGIFSERSDHLCITLKNDCLNKYLTNEEVEDFFRIINKFNEKIKIDLAYKKSMRQYFLRLYNTILFHHKSNLNLYSSEYYCRKIVYSLYNYINFHLEKLDTKQTSQEKIIFRALNYFENNSNSKFDLNRLAFEIYASRRSIQYAFSKTLGITPLQFFRMFKMNLIRVDIIKNNNNKKYISDILSFHNVSNVGRFSCEYLEFFGERPNYTLKNKSIVAQPLSLNSYT